MFFLFVCTGVSVVYFFFSSRRRHTRWTGDWSSDVCSSDLSRDVTGSPTAYAAYIRQSRGEFSAAKPSCMAFQNAWVSDRTVAYLASGKPAVVQHTGASVFLPDGEGMFRFRSLAE